MTWKYIMRLFWTLMALIVVVGICIIAELIT